MTFYSIMDQSHTSEKWLELPLNRKTLKADTHEGFCSRSMLQAHFVRASTHEGASSSSLNLPWDFAPKYLTG